MALLTNLIEYYTMNGNSSDAVGSNNGSDTSITYNSGNGIVPQGAGFNGSSSKIDLSNQTSGTGDYSWAFWMKTTQTAQSFPWAQRDGTSPPYGQWFFSINNTGTDDHKVSFFDYDGAGGAGSGFDFASSGTPSVNDGNWHYIVFTKTGTTGLLYIDGVLNVSPTAAKNVSYAGGMVGSVGYNRRDVSQFYGGALDEMGIWTRVLSPTEITELYNGGAGLTYPFTHPATFKSWNGVDLANIKKINGVS
jgi:hypothetical protein